MRDLSLTLGAAEKMGRLFDELTSANSGLWVIPIVATV